MSFIAPLRIQICARQNQVCIKYSFVGSFLILKFCPGSDLLNIPILFPSVNGIFLKYVHYFS